jgi:hypothetical protein
MRYPWEAIDGYRFESLAYDYVQDRYPEQNWAMLPLSGDGNRDIESHSRHYFLGQDVDYSIWVEAKYTRSFTRSLGKGRLDPTLVSALIEPNVGAVLFISNGRFNAAYITRAERALRVRHIPTSPSFVDGETLEYWLDSRSNVAHAYFGGVFPPIEIDADKRHPLTVHSGQLVAMDDYRAGHIERRNRLVNKEEYVLQLLVGSSERSKVVVSAEGIGLALQESPEFPTTISIREGLTPISLRVVANRQTNSGRLLTTLHNLADDRKTRHRTSYSIALPAVRIRSAGQLKAWQALSRRIDQHQRVPGARSVRLVGGPAVGKTWILSRLSTYVPLDVPVRQYGFTENPSTNAQSLCRALLFMTFGTALEFDGLKDALARVQTEDITSLLVSQLLEGSASPQRASEVISNLMRGDDLGPMFTRYPRGDSKILVLDDVHKADSATLAILNRLLSEFAQSDNRTLLILSSREAREDLLADAIAPSLIADISVDPITNRDIEETLRDIVGTERGKLLSEDASPAISNVLELRHLAEYLRAEGAVLRDLQVPDFMRRCRELLRDTTVASIAGRLRTPVEQLCADAVFIAEGGISARFAEEHFGGGLVERLVESGLVRKTVGESPVLFPAHDLLKDAYLARRNVYSRELGDLLDHYMRRHPERRVDLLGHLCRCGAGWRSRYLSDAIEMRDDLVSQSRFGAARALAETLYDLVVQHGREKIGLDEPQYLQTLFAHADCTNHTRSARLGLELFGEVLAKSEECLPSAKRYAFAAQAKSEMFNARFWLMDHNGLVDEIDGFVKSLDSLPSIVMSEWRVREARFTALNRKMMVQFVLDQTEAAEQTFKSTIALAKEQNDLPNWAHLLMDKGKSLYLANPKDALDLLEGARAIYSSVNSEHRRLSVCSSQTAFLKIVLGGGHVAELELAAEQLRVHGYTSEYTNALLELAAVNLCAGRQQEAVENLVKLDRRTSKLENPRRYFLYLHLKAVMSALIGDTGKAAQLNDEYTQCLTGLGPSYMKVALHNTRLRDCDKVSWAHIGGANNLWIDNRLW